MIPYAHQDIDASDIEAVNQVLRSDFLTQGPTVPRFEETVALKCNAQYALAVSNATSALHLTYLALGLGPGDRLWTSPLTFVASSNSALHCGAEVDFVDIDDKTYNLCPKALEIKLIKAKKEGRLPKVVVPVHFGGQACDMKAIYDLSQNYGFKIVEDASHAIGGLYLREPIGNTHYSDALVFSFHPVKIITTGEGGMVLTNNSELAERIALLRSHGITRDKHLLRDSKQGAWYYEQIALGFNYRMTDIQAALGLSQLQRLDDFILRRHELALQYNKQLASLPIITPYQSPDCYSAFHLYVIRLKLKELNKSRHEVFDALKAKGIGVNVHYIPVHLQPYYQDLGFKKGQFPKAEEYYEDALSIPMYAALSDEHQEQVCQALEEVL